MPRDEEGPAATPGTIGFRGVPEEVWNFHIGGYQVCEKWLKDRKGRTLSEGRHRPLPEDRRRPRRDHPPDEGDRRGHRAARRLAGGVPDGGRPRGDIRADNIPAPHRQIAPREALGYLHPLLVRRNQYVRPILNRIAQCLFVSDHDMWQSGGQTAGTWDSLWAVPGLQEHAPDGAEAHRTLPYSRGLKRLADGHALPLDAARDRARETPCPIIGVIPDADVPLSRVAPRRLTQNRRLARVPCPKTTPAERVGSAPRTRLRVTRLRHFRRACVPRRRDSLGFPSGRAEPPSGESK